MSGSNPAGTISSEYTAHGSEKAGAKALAFSSTVLRDSSSPNRTRFAGLRFGKNQAHRYDLECKKSKLYSSVVKMAITPDCLSGDRGFEPRRSCQTVPSTNRTGHRAFNPVMRVQIPLGS